ncbi:hypothetical protein ACF07Y_38875 [Streptomyces sp. NPDC016566]|uniref:hypothetical protein n=1 Tax=Streptomyces sp. NPDC016566 TaxID=3364967 RepID=UPI0036F50326
MTLPNRFNADPDKVLASLKDMLNGREEWDELPEWGVLYADAQGRVLTRPLPVPPQIWIDAGDPKRLLHLFHNLLTRPATLHAATQGENLRRMLPKDFSGLYLRTEGWGAPQAQARELHQRLQAGGSVPRFETMKDRQELRLGTAVDTGGYVYLAQQTRQTMCLEGFYSRGKSQASGSDSTVSGEVPALLSQILTALLTPTPAMRAQARRNGL